MLVRAADWKRPTDGDFAFSLRALTPALPRLGERVDVREVAGRTLTDEAAASFAAKVSRWTGPEDVIAGEQPWAVEQLWFEEAPWTPRLSRADLEPVMRGATRVMRSPSTGQVDYLMRDHHTVDAVLYHYATTGEMPRAMFHADRHSDWCNDQTLSARTPQQAATWWALLEGLKRPETNEPVLREREVIFCTAEASLQGEHRGVGASLRIPGCVDPSSISWPQALEDQRIDEVDWVSLDLDCFQPAAQLKLVGGLIRDDRFAAMMARARVRMFVLSPQFLSGGDKIKTWTLQGSLSSSLRLLNVLRAALRPSRSRTRRAQGER